MVERLAKEVETKIVDEFKKQGSLLNRTELAKDLGVNRHTISKVIKRNTGKAKIGSTKKAKISSAAGRSLQHFIENYDDSFIIPRAIEDGVEKFLRDADGEPGYMDDREFRVKCGVSISKWRRYADEFRHLQIKTNNEIIWGHPAIIKKMREIVAR